jgi:hypothetical protein
MSKLIVDQIAKNGGVPLTVPAADGVANAVIKSDGAGVLGFTGFGLPTTAGTTGQFLKKGAGTASVWGGAPAPVVDDSINVLASLVTTSARQNVYSTGEWSSSGPNSTYYHSWSDANSTMQGWNMFLGDGYPDGTSQPMYANDGGSNSMQRRIEYANGDRIGRQQADMEYNENVTSNYAGVTWRCMPIRNTTAADVSRVLSVYLSSKDSNYGGAGIHYYTPDVATYAATASGTWTSAWQGGNDSASTNRSGTVVIPANTTVLVFTLSSHQYATTYRFKDSNMPYNLDAFFGAELVCDNRMLSTIAIGRMGNIDGVTNTQVYPWTTYNLCATMYGDR